MLLAREKGRLKTYFEHRSNEPKTHLGNLDGYTVNIERMRSALCTINEEIGGENKNLGSAGSLN